MSDAEPMSRPLIISPERESSRPLVQVLHDWIVTVDHKRLGLMYFSYGILFLVIGGVEASIMRAQLAVANNHLVSPETFNRLFTMHGTTMIFFAAMPIVFGFANYLVPLMIGARDMAFPRLNAWSFWMSALGGIILYFSFVGGSRPVRRGHRARRRLVRLRAADLAGLFRGTQHRLLDHRHSGERLRQHWYGAERADDHSVHALSRHDA